MNGTEDHGHGGREQRGGGKGVPELERYPIDLSEVQAILRQHRSA